MLWAHNQWIGLLILIVVFLIVTFPVSIFTFEGYWNWINKIKKTSAPNEVPEKEKLNQKSESSNESKYEDIKYWLFTILFGFFGIRSRLMKLPSFLRVALFISVVMSIFLPIFTFDVDGIYGFMFMFGLG